METIAQIQGVICLVKADVTDHGRVIGHINTEYQAATGTFPGQCPGAIFLRGQRSIIEAEGTGFKIPAYFQQTLPCVGREGANLQPLTWDYHGISTIRDGCPIEITALPLLWGDFPVGYLA